MDPRQPRGTFVASEVLVKFRAGLARGVERAAHAAVGTRVLSRIGGGLDIDHVRLPRGLTVAAAVQRYAASPLVEWAEPNFYRFPTSPPDDTMYDELWALHNTGLAHPISDPLPPPGPDTAMGTADADMDVEEAWDTEQGDPNVIIGVLDTGVDVTHPDLIANLWVNSAEASGDPSVDDDANGCVDDVNGCDFTKSTPSGVDLLEDSDVMGFDHGTHVAGTIAGVTHNGSGVSGVCGGDGTPDSGCKIMILKFMEPVSGSMQGDAGAEIAAITYARNMGADIINASFGGPSWMNSEREAIRKAGALSDILFVAAAGNDSLDNDTLDGYDTDGDGFGDIFAPSYPGSYNLPHILAVAASNHNDEYGYFTGCDLDGNPVWFCAFTSFGRYSVDVAAPGVDILSTVPANNYATFNGTSMAAPHAAGVAGLLLSQEGTRSALTLKNIIMTTADTTEADGVTLLPLYDSVRTYLSLTEVSGHFTRSRARVNANDAVNFVGTAPNGSANHDGDIPGALGMSGSKVTGSLAWPADVSDFRKKKLTARKTYRFTLVVPPGRNFDLLLYKADAKEVWQPSAVLRFAFTGTGAGNDETFTFKPGATRTFFIQPNTFYTNGNYTLKVVCIKNC